MIIKVFVNELWAGRTKHGELRARWVIASLNEDDCVQRSRFYLNMSPKWFVDITFVSTPSTKYYNAFSNLVFAFSSPTMKMSDSALSIAFGIYGSACFANICFASSWVFLWIFWVGDGWVDRRFRILSSSRLERKVLDIWMSPDPMMVCLGRLFSMPTGIVSGVASFP